MSTVSVLRPRAVRPRHLAGLREIAGVSVPADCDVSISGVSHRADAVLPGDLFVARAGARAHGADFAAAAAAAGAVAILTDADGARRAGAVGVPVVVGTDPWAVLGPVSSWVYDDPSAAVSVLGITGTQGKTTTTYLIAGGARAAGATTGLIGSVETLIEGERVPNARTTPEAPELQALLAVMRERGVGVAAMEVSSHALAQRRVDGTRFAVGGFTNLGQDHLDFHSGMEDYFAAKAKLFDGRAHREVVTIDDSWGRRLVAPGTVTVSLVEPGAAWTADRVGAGAGGGATFRAHGPDDLVLEVSLGLPGRFNVANALLALAVLHAGGIDPAAAIPGLEPVQVPGRMERIAAGQDFAAYVDYAHKPGAVAAVLAALRGQLTGGARIIIVLGAGGDRDRGKRPLMGAAAARGAGLVIVTDDNPRTEDPATIRAEVLGGARSVTGSGGLREIGDRRAAIAAAVAAAGPDDVVVVAGKGHEPGQEVGGVVHPFDDRDVLRAEIEARISGCTSGSGGR